MTAAPMLMFSGMIAGDPDQGGAAWAVLQYLLGFKKLGWNVCFVEPVSPAKLQPAGVPFHQSANASYFRRVMADFDMTDSSAMLLSGTRQTIGLTYETLLDFARHSTALFNVSGMLSDPALLELIPTRVYLDLDPAFVQLWHTQGIDMRFAGHTHFVSVGRFIGRPECPIPTCNLDWRHSLPPVVLDLWPFVPTEPTLGFSTIGNWRGYGSIHFDGNHYGQKAHSARLLIELPKRIAQTLTLAMSIHPDERDDLLALAANDWTLADPSTVAGTPRQYQAFIANSRGEIGIAKSGYVVSRCGWFSDRSACYLACGRPVIAQDTGFSRFIPVGRGLLAFTTVDDAIAAMESIDGDYIRHRRAARDLAETFFNSDRVLSQLIQKVGLG